MLHEASEKPEKDREIVGLTESRIVFRGHIKNDADWKDAKYFTDLIQWAYVPDVFEALRTPRLTIPWKPLDEQPDSETEHYVYPDYDGDIYYNTNLFRGEPEFYCTEDEFRAAILASLPEEAQP